MRRLSSALTLGWCVAAIAIAVLATCADFNSPVDLTGGAPDDLVATPSFAAHVQPILELRCAIGGCHSVATAQGMLTLTAGNAYDDLVNVASRARPSMFRVRPFFADSSWLVRVIEADPEGRGGTARMPLSSLPLTANQIGTIVNWINQGAVRN